MADSNILPGPRSWPAMPPEWFRFFRDLQTAAETPAPDAPDLSGFLPKTANLAGNMSVQSFGTLASGFVDVNLVGDSPAPGNVKYYGTDETGAKGYHDAVAVTFETTSKNLAAWDAEFAYTLGILDTITYTDGVETIVKTFGYTGDQLTTLTLSGDTPDGIDLIKTLTYTGDELTSVAYS